MKNPSYSPLALGISMAATWTWANAVVAGIGLMHDKGLAPYFIWTVVNCLAIPCFGLLVFRWPGFWRIAHSRLYRIIMGAYLFPLTWMNMQGLYEVLGMTNAASAATWQIAVLVMGIGIVLAITWGGFRLSLQANVIEWTLIMTVIIVALVWAIMNAGDTAPVLQAGWENVPIWGLWMSVILLVSPPIAAPQFELASHARSLKPFLIGGGVFSVFMILVTAASMLALNIGSVWLLAGLIVLTSGTTMNAAASSWQYLLQARWPGFVLGMAAVLSWPLVARLGLLALWAYLGIIIVPLVGITLLIAYLTSRNKVGVYGRSPKQANA